MMYSLWNTVDNIQPCTVMDAKKHHNCDLFIMYKKDFPSAVVKNLPANAEDTSSIPGLGRFHMPWSN